MARRLNTTQKTKDWATRTLLKTRVNSDYTESVRSSCVTNDTRHVILVENPAPWYLQTVQKPTYDHPSVYASYTEDRKES
jgi:hypothetical protein